MQQVSKMEKERGLCLRGESFLSNLQRSCHRSTGSPLALLGIRRGGVTVLEGAGILARGTGFCT